MPLAVARRQRGFPRGKRWHSARSRNIVSDIRRAWRNASVPYRRGNLPTADDQVVAARGSSTGRQERFHDCRQRMRLESDRRRTPRRTADISSEFHRQSTGDRRTRCATAIGRRAGGHVPGRGRRAPNAPISQEAQSRRGRLPPFPSGGDGPVPALRAGPRRPNRGPDRQDLGPSNNTNNEAANRHSGG